MHLHPPSDPSAALPIDERIRLAEQAVIARDERVRGLGRQLAERWHVTRGPRMAQGAGAGLLAALGSWIVRRAFSARPALRHLSASSPRMDLLLQFLPLLLPVLPARLQRWVKPSRLMLGLALAAPLFAAWQAKRQRAQEEADERALIQQVLQEQRVHYEALRERLPQTRTDPPADAEGPALPDDLARMALQREAQYQQARA
jgi:hypothetical protein